MEKRKEKVRGELPETFLPFCQRLLVGFFFVQLQSMELYYIPKMERTPRIFSMPTQQLEYFITITVIITICLHFH